MNNETLDSPKPAPHGESRFWSVLMLGLLVALVALGIGMNYGMTAFEPESGRYRQWQTLLGVIVTLGIFSILYKENPVFRFLEHIFIGLATGFSAVFLWFNFVEPKWFIPMMPESLVQGTRYNAPADVTQGQWWLFFALLVGLLFFTVYVPRLAWMNRLAIGMVMGFSAGLGLQMFIGLIGPQLTSSFKPPITHYNTGEPIPAGMPFDANNIRIADSDWYVHPFAIVFIVILVCTLAYFIFSVEQRKGWIRKPANAGRYFLMITLGSIFGTTVMGRFSLLIARFEFVIASVQGWWHALVK